MPPIRSLINLVEITDSYELQTQKKQTAQKCESLPWDHIQKNTLKEKQFHKEERSLEIASLSLNAMVAIFSVKRLQIALDS